MRIVILIIAVAALACSKKEAAAPAEAEPTAEAATEAEGAPKAEEDTAPNPAEMLEEGEEELPPELRSDTPLLVGAPATIKVVDAGGEPKAPLRFAIEGGVEQKANIDVGFGLEAVVVVMHVRNPAYVVDFDLVLSPRRVRKNGSTRVDFRVEDANIDLELINSKRKASLERALDGVRKVKGSYTLDQRGHIADLEIRVPKKAVQESHDMTDNLRVALVQMTPALPEEPVGPGAKWTAHQSIEQGGVRVNQLRTFELASIDGGMVTLEVELRQTATEQPFETPGKPMPLQLKVLRGEGTGTLTWDFTKLTPHAADMESSVLKGVRQDIEEDGVPKPADSAVHTTRTVQIGPSNE